MEFVIFIALLFSVSLFHRREHQHFIAGLRALQRELASPAPVQDEVKKALKAHDWRLIDLKTGKAWLRRAFDPKGGEAVARYAVPVALLAAMPLLLQAWKMAAVYFAVLVIKWFATVTVLDLSPHHPHYDVRLAGFRLFGETLEEKAEKDKAG